MVLIGVEGTGSYGTGLTRHLQGLGIAVVEVDRPNRQRRRRSRPRRRDRAPARREQGGKCQLAWPLPNAVKTDNNDFGVLKLFIRREKWLYKFIF